MSHTISKFDGEIWATVGESGICSALNIAHDSVLYLRMHRVVQSAEETR